MTQVAGYWVDMFGMQFNDPTQQSWIHAMPLGTYEHPVYGTIKITPERVQRFADNVNNKVRVTDLDIDYDHKVQNGEAAGWVKQAEARIDGLWILVEWTARAYQQLKDRAYRYFSPEFTDTWTNPKTNVTYTDVLNGGGITNRPFLKDILPINLSEVFADSHLAEGGKNMDEQLKQLAKLFGLAEDATIDQILEAAQVKLDNNKAPVEDEQSSNGQASMQENGQQSSVQQQAPVQQATELSADIKKLAETNPAIAALVQNLEIMGKQLSENTAALKLAETNEHMIKLNETAKAKGYTLSPVAQDAIKNLLITSPDKKFSDTVVQAYDQVLNGLVELSERGASRNNNTDSDSIKQFSDAVDKLVKVEKMSYTDAVSKVAMDNPELFDSYRSEAYSGRE